jgi:hypothetical protein
VLEDAAVPGKCSIVLSAAYARARMSGIALSPGLDRCKLSLNGFVAYGRVKVLGAFFQALQEVVGYCLARCSSV